jgi:site-specific recombinase XerD
MSHVYYTKGVCNPLEQLQLFPPTEKDRQGQEEPTLSPTSTLHRALATFHGHMLDLGFSPYTVRAFDSDLRLLSRYLGPRKLLGEISAGQLQGFLKYLQRERAAPCNLKSLARRLTTLKVFFAWLAEERVINEDPAAPLVHRRVSTPLPRVLSDELVAELLATTNLWRYDPQRADTRPHQLITKLLDTGIKKGECMGIALQDIDASDPKTASVFIRYPSIRHRFKERRLHLSAGFCSVLPEYLAQYQPRSNLLECTARNLEYVLDQCEKRAAMPPQSLSFEILRWTSALRALKAGADEDALRRRLGLSHITWVDTIDKLRRLAAPAL